MIVLILGLITFLGTLLRLENLSPYKFYPDAYQNLVVAQNLANYQSVFGRLGEVGMPYPYFFMWTRPGYPLIINAVNLFINNLSFSAQLINVICGILVIPLAYLLISKIYKSTVAGVVAALITAISFNLTVWGGYIYTESLGVFLIMLLLWRLFARIDLESEWADVNDFVVGFILSFAVFTRYEYLILILPIAFMIYKKTNHPFKKIINIAISSAFTASIILTLLYPVDQLAGIIFFQLSRLLILAGVLLVGSIFIYIISRLNYLKFRNPIWINSLIMCLIILLSGIVMIQSIWGSGSPLYYEFTAVRNFFSSDFILGLLSLMGSILMLKRGPQQAVIYFVFISVCVLFPVYYNINPQMQRYITHLLPFLLIPASFAGLEIYRLIQGRAKSVQRVPAGLLVLCLFLAQITLSYKGIKEWHDGGWFRQSYEEKSARILNEKLPKGEGYLLISAFPEAYNFFTNRSTYSIRVDDQNPFLDIDSSLDSQSVYIIADMGMRDLFPNFDNFLEQGLTSEKIFEYSVGEIYRYGIKSKSEDRPVRVYKTTIGDLKQQINQMSRSQNQ